MAMQWSIEDGQSVPFEKFTGEDRPALRGLLFSTGADTNNVILTLQCDDGSSYALTFNRNGTPQGAAVKTEAPAAEGATATATSSKGKK